MVTKRSSASKKYNPKKKSVSKKTDGDKAKRLSRKYRKEINALRQEIDILKPHTTSLTQKITENKTEIATCAAIRSELEKRIAAQENQIVMLEANLKEQEHANTELKSSHASLVTFTQEQFKAGEQKLVLLRQENADRLSELRETITREHEAQLEKIQLDHKSELARLSQEYSDQRTLSQQEQVAALSKVQLAFQQQLQDALSKKDADMKHVFAMEKAAWEKAKDAEVEQLKNQYQASMDEMREALVTNTDLTSALKTQHANAIKSIDAKHQEVLAHIQELENQHGRDMEQINTLTANLTTSASTIASLRALQVTFEKQVATLTKTLQSSEVALKECSEKGTMNATTITDLQKQLTELNIQLAGMTNKIRSYDEQIALMNKEFDDMEKVAVVAKPVSPKKKKGTK